MQTSNQTLPFCTSYSTSAVACLPRASVVWRGWDFGLPENWVILSLFMMDSFFCFLVDVRVIGKMFWRTGLSIFVYEEWFFQEFGCLHWLVVQFNWLGFLRRYGWAIAFSRVYNSTWDLSFWKDCPVYQVITASWSLEAKPSWWWF